MTPHRILTDDELRAYGDIHVAVGLIIGSILTTLVIYIVLPILVRALA